LPDESEALKPLPAKRPPDTLKEAVDARHLPGKAIGVPHHRALRETKHASPNDLHSPVIEVDDALDLAALGKPDREHQSAMLRLKEPRLERI